MAKSPTNLNSRSTGDAKERGSQSGMKARSRSSTTPVVTQPDVPWQKKVKNSKLNVLDLKRESNRNAKRDRYRRAKVDAGLPMTRHATWWDSVRPLFHFFCLVSLIYVLVFAACDFTAGSIAKEVKAGHSPIGHGAFCYTLRLLDFGPLNTKDLTQRALCATLPDYAMPAT